jgi:hypothetical protein
MPKNQDPAETLAYRIYQDKSRPMADRIDAARALDASEHPESPEGWFLPALVRRWPLTDDEAIRIYCDSSRPMADRITASVVLDDYAYAEGRVARAAWDINRELITEWEQKVSRYDEQQRVREAEANRRKRVTLTVVADFEGEYYGSGELVDVCSEWIESAFNDRDDHRSTQITGTVVVLDPESGEDS